MNRPDALALESASFRAVANVNGRVNTPIFLYRKHGESSPVPLLAEDLNLASSDCRAKVVGQLPESDREEVARLLLELSASVASAQSAPRDAKDGGNEPQGSAVAFAPVEPWPEPVDGAALLDEIAATVARYIVLPTGAAEAIALWVLHTHTHATAYVSPLLAITAPEKRCGKSTVLSLLARLVPRPLPTSNISPASVFRVVEEHAPTILIDEGDTFLRDNDDLRGLLNSGHTRDAAFVVRTVGDKYEVRTFTTWCPKAIAAIGSLPDTLADRSIPITMHRKAPGERVERLRLDRLGAICEPLRSRAARWAADTAGTLRDADPDVPEALNDRQADNWRPLFAIADAAGGHWPDHARRAALATSGRIEEDTTPAIQLLADLRDLYAERTDDIIPSSAIAAHLGTLEGRPWPEWRHGQPISPTGVAKLLKRFGIFPRKDRVGSKTVRGYHRTDLEDAFSRYLPPQTATTATRLQDNELQHSQIATPRADVAVAKTPKSLPFNDVAVVAAAGGGDGANEEPAGADGYKEGEL